MERRDFVRMSVLSTAGLVYLPGTLFADPGSVPDFTPGLLKEIELEINPDGSFNLRAGGIMLHSCYPSFDMEQVKPVEVLISEAGRVIEYILPGNKKLLLSFKYDQNKLVISSQLHGFETLPRFIFPLSQAEVSGAEKYFKQGMGFAGPSGIFSFPAARPKMEQAILKEEVWSYDSYLMTGLFDDLNALSVSVNDHSRFLFRSTLYNKHFRFGLIDRHLNTEKIFLKTGFQTEGIDVQKNTTNLPDIRLGCSTDAFGLFRSTAKEIAAFNKVNLTHSPRYYYCSWYDKEYEYTQKDLDEKLKSLARIKPPVSLQAIQIDDGYAPLGDWLNHNFRFPMGMKHAFSEIKKAGYNAGIWVGPFMVSSESFIFREHQDWLLRDHEGNIIKEWDTYHSGGSVHVLDTSHPGAFEYLRTVFKTFREWGATTFKTDFLDWGLRDSSLVTRYRPGKTSVEYFREVAQMIRETIGPESYWLACIAPYAPLIGLVDGMRVSNDVSPTWSRESTVNMFKEMFYGQYFNNVFWQNDPDVCYLRSYNSQLSDNEKLAIAYYDGIMGGVVNTSDHFGKISDDQLEIFRFLNPGKERVTAELPFWGKESDIITVVRNYIPGKSWGLLLVNTTDRNTSLHLGMDRIVHQPSVNVYEWSHTHNNFMGKLESIQTEIPARSCNLFFLSTQKKAPEKSLRISGLVES